MSTKQDNSGEKQNKMLEAQRNVWQKLGRDTCLAPKGVRRSICGPRPKKVVHHCYRRYLNMSYIAVVVSSEPPCVSFDDVLYTFSE